MSSAKEVLTSDDYTNYRNVRAVAVLFIVVGGFFGLGGLGLTFVEPRTNKENVNLVMIGLGTAFVGFAGLIGGIATLKGNRRWSQLVYVMGVIYLFAFPLGTILSVVLLNGLSRYLDSKERIRIANSSTTSGDAVLS